MRCFTIGLRAGLLPALLLPAVLLGLGSETSFGQSIVRVEEDWEMVVAGPDNLTDAPQITCVISPLRCLDGLHALLELNHHTMTAYVAGGIQLQLWNGHIPVAEKNFPNDAMLNTAGETVAWTQSMSLTGGVMTVEVIRGSSQTWGEFGGEGNLKIVVNATLGDLNGYHPDVSVANSRIGFAANRVQSLVLKRVRLFTSTGEQLEDTTQRVVHQQN